MKIVMMFALLGLMSGNVASAQEGPVSDTVNCDEIVSDLAAKMPAANGTNVPAVIPAAAPAN